MRITHKLLVEHGACEKQCERFRDEYPDGLVPTVEAAITAAASGYDVLWLVRLLPVEGAGSQRAFAIWCAEQVAHLSSDARVAQCLSVVCQKVADPESVSDEELAAAWEAAGAVAEEFAGGAAGEAARVARTVAWTARDAAWPVARAAARDVGATAWAAWAAAGAAAEAVARAAWEAASAAAGDAACAVARAAAWDAAGAAAGEAQIAMLAEMLADA